MEDDNRDKVIEKMMLLCWVFSQWCKACIEERPLAVIMDALFHYVNKVAVDAGYRVDKIERFEPLIDEITEELCNSHLSPLFERAQVQAPWVKA